MAWEETKPGEKVAGFESANGQCARGRSSALVTEKGVRV